MNDWSLRDHLALWRVCFRSVSRVCHGRSKTLQVDFNSWARHQSTKATSRIFIQDNYMDGLEHVEKLLSIIRSHGWNDAFSEDVLYSVPQINYGHSDDQSLISLRQSLKDSKDCMATLAKITCYLRRKIRRLEKRTMPLVLEEGIRRLPDELLANIFELGHLSTLDGEYAFRGVSRVSRRFRAVSLKTPILWTRICAMYPEAQIQTFLSRSGQLDLEIETMHPNCSQLEPLLKSLGDYSHRWSCLNVYEPVIEYLLEKLGLTKFPRLRYLYHSWDVEIFKCQWEMPSLSHIEGHYWHIHPGLRFPPRLTTFEIALDNMDTVDTGGLAQALQSMGTLRDLSVKLSNCRANGQVAGWNNLKAHSVQIDKLSIGIDEATELEVAWALFDALAFLKATIVEITLDNLTGTQSDYLETEHGKFFPFGTTIVLHMSAWISFPNLFRAIGQYCGIAHTVHFDIPKGGHFDGQDAYTLFPSIRHIEFHNCLSLHEEHVTFMLKHSMFADVEDFKLVSCPNVSEKFLLDCQDDYGEKILLTV